MQKQQVIITAPSLDPTKNVSGVSAVVSFIIKENSECEYLHFKQGKEDNESGNVWARLKRVFVSYTQWKAFLKGHPDAIIHYNWPLSKPSIIRDYPFIRYALKHKRKIVVHLHGGQFLDNDNTPWYLKRIMRKVFSLDIPFIVLSDAEKNLLKDRFGVKQIDVLPNCVPISEDCNERILPENGMLRLGYLGRIENHKGMDELLEACKRIEVPFSLSIAGKETNENEYIPRFRQLLGNRFEYVGVVSGKEKDSFLRNIDVFVLPSHFEGLPMSLLESMSYCSVPVVTPVGSIPTICSDRENALLIEKHSSDAIVEAVTKLSHDRELTLRLAKNARVSIEERFSTKEYVEKLNGIYLGLRFMV